MQNSQDQYTENHIAKFCLWLVSHDHKLCLMTTYEIHMEHELCIVIMIHNYMIYDRDGRSCQSVVHRHFTKLKRIGETSKKKTVTEKNIHMQTFGKLFPCLKRTQ